MRTPVLYAVDEDGKEVLRELFTPLFTTLAPGFEVGAEELRVEATRADGPDFQVVCSYVTGGTTFPLSVAVGYHPWITSSRIRIVCGLSIIPGIPCQDGKMTVRLDERTIAVKVQIMAKQGREVMSFYPIWDAASANKTVQRTGASRSTHKTRRTSSAAGSRR